MKPLSHTKLVMKSFTFSFDEKVKSECGAHMYSAQLIPLNKINQLPSEVTLSLNIVHRCVLQSQYQYSCSVMASVFEYIIEQRATLRVRNTPGIRSGIKLWRSLKQI